MVNFRDSQFLIFDLDGKDIINVDNFERFVIIEESGNYLPQYELIFRTSDLSILKLIKESAILKVTYGGSLSDSVEITFIQILEKDFLKEGDCYLVTLKGVYATQYSTTASINAYVGTSLSVISKVVSRNFQNYIISTRSTRDNQVWIQYNITDRKFVTEVWLHSYIDNNDMLLLGITGFGKFKALTVKDIISNSWKAYGINRNLGDREFIFNGISVKSHTGFINKVFSNREVAVYDRNQGIYNIEITKPETILGLTTDSDSALSPRLQTQIIYDSDNVHPYFATAYERNISNLFFMSRTEVELIVGGKFLPIEVLDSVSLIDANSQAAGFEDLYSGLYIVSRIARTFTKKNIVNIITLSRDTLNLD